MARLIKLSIKSINNKMILLVLLNFVFLSAQASPTNPAAECLDRFLNRLNTIKSYKAELFRKEYRFGELREANEIEISQTRLPRTTQLVYLNQGSTGIKNNGMIVSWDGKESVNITLGKTKGLGFLANGAASAFLKGPIHLTSEKLLMGEYFTINRAGLFAISDLFKKRLSYFKTQTQQETQDQKGLFIREKSTHPGRCLLRYNRHTNEFDERLLKPQDDLFAIEDEYSTLAYAIVEANSEHFSDINQIFHRKKDYKIKIPRGFFDFDLDLDDSLQGSFKLTLYLRGKVLGEYFYKTIYPNY